LGKTGRQDKQIRQKIGLLFGTFCFFGLGPGRRRKNLVFGILFLQNVVFGIEGRRKFSFWDKKEGRTKKRNE
jgi:hypothetical protein